jgi:hypothetical protein
LFDGPVSGRFMSSVTKCDVAPELTIILISFRLVARRVHLLPFGVVLIVYIMLICFSASSSSSSSSCCSGVQ